MTTQISKLGGLVARTALYAADLRADAFPVVIRLGDGAAGELVRGVASGIATASRAVQGGLFETMDPVIRYPMSHAALPVVVIESGDGSVMIANSNRDSFLVVVVNQEEADMPLAVIGAPGSLTIRLSTDANGDAVGDTLAAIAAAVAELGPPWFAIVYGDGAELVTDVDTQDSDAQPTPQPELGGFVRVYDAATSEPIAPWMRIDEVTTHPSNPEWRARLGTLDRGEG